WHRVSLTKFPGLTLDDFRQFGVPPEALDQRGGAEKFVFLQGAFAHLQLRAERLQLIFVPSGSGGGFFPVQLFLGYPDHEDGFFPAVEGVLVELESRFPASATPGIEDAGCLGTIVKEAEEGIEACPIRGGAKLILRRAILDLDHLADCLECLTW